MPSTCSILFCPNKLGTKGKSFFTFPSDTRYRQAWIEKTGRGNSYVPKKAARICEDHFSKLDFFHPIFDVDVIWKKTLHKDAIPSLKLPIFHVSINIYN